MTMTLNKAILALTAVILISSCATVNISEDMSPAELIQRANEAMDRNRYGVATQYYQALYDRNPTNIDLMITAEYHVAFILYKQGKYDQAREGLNGVIKYYNTPDEELLPQHYKRLSQIVLQTIDDKSQKRIKPLKKRSEE